MAVERRLTGRDLLGGDWGTPDFLAVDVSAVLRGLPAEEKARLSRELLVILGDRSESVSHRAKAALAFMSHAEGLGLKGSVTMARALARILEAEFLGGPRCRRRRVTLIRVLEGDSHRERYRFLQFLLGAVRAVHRGRGGLLWRRVARLAAGTPLGLWMRRTLREGERLRWGKSRRRGGKG